MHEPRGTPGAIGTARQALYAKGHATYCCDRSGRRNLANQIILRIADIDIPGLVDGDAAANSAGRDTPAKSITVIAESQPEAGGGPQPIRVPKFVEVPCESRDLTQGSYFANRLVPTVSDENSSIARDGHSAGPEKSRHRAGPIRRPSHAAGESRHDSGRSNSPDSVVASIGDVNVVRGIRGKAAREIEPGCRAHSVLGACLSPAACECGHLTSRSDFPDGVPVAKTLGVPSVRDKEVALA